MTVSGSLLLSDGVGGAVSLIVTDIAYSLKPNLSKVMGYKSVWFTQPTIEVTPVTVTYQMPTVAVWDSSIYFQLDYWAEHQSILTIEGEFENIINWSGVIVDCPYTWKYNEPSPAGQLTILTGVNWVYDIYGGVIPPEDLYPVIGGNLVTQTVSQIENKYQKLQQQQQARQQSADQEQLREWIAEKQQFTGYSITYLPNGKIDIEFPNKAVLTNMTPTWKLFSAMAGGTLKAPSSGWQFK